MLEVPFKLNSPGQISPANKLVSFSLPLPMAECFNTDHLRLVAQHEKFHADFVVLNHWPDRSIKWLRCHFIIPETHYTRTSFKLINTSANEAVQAFEPLEVKCSSAVIQIKNQRGQFQLAKGQLAVEQIPWQIKLLDNTNKPLTLEVTNCQLDNNNKTLQCQVYYQGLFKNQAQHTALTFNCILTFNAANDDVQVDFTLRNPNPMLHNNGKWDLGNKNSFEFTSFTIDFLNTCTKATKLTLSDSTRQTIHCGEFTLLQASSGGNNWQSNNHVNKNGDITLPFQGYQLSYADQVLDQGLRATPLLTTIQGENTLSIAYPQFWQNFPKALSSQSNTVTLSLFPDMKNQLHELQPGEQKTHRFIMAYGVKPTDIKTQLCNQQQVTICPKYLCKTGAIPFYSDSSQEKITELIGQGINSSNNFFRKREIIDEFGWRNFGDLYADHEVLEYQGNKELISHYNNQYDALYGFIGQFLSTGNTQWWQLADDLALHTKDIDIYHTEKDRIEYNHGLFWHTDHYLPAETATHRTYSCLQQANAYQDHSGGGGPGGQHCYTTGLTLHYLLTAEQSSKDAVLHLADWISNYYEGTDTLAEFLLSIKNRHRPDFKNKLTGQYPLDRGTGNYIIALLDAFELTAKQSYLDKVSVIIKNTAWPTENLAYRQLDNVEESWFYTIFLQALTRYLLVKSQLNQVDQSWYFSQQLLLHFADWMITHETPYLDKPELLEYPNHTWTAQDLRKANIFYCAYFFAGKNNIQAQHYKTKADAFYDYVYRNLAQEKTSSTTRILAILMQNVGMKSFIEQSNQFNFHQCDDSHAEISQPKPSKKLLWKIFISTLLNTTITKELTWLCHRSSKFNKLLGGYLT